MPTLFRDKGHLVQPLDYRTSHKGCLLRRLFLKYQTLRTLCERFTCCSCSCVLERSEVSWLQPTSSWLTLALSEESATLSWSSQVASLDTDALFADMASVSMKRSCAEENMPVGFERGVVTCWKFKIHSSKNPEQMCFYWIVDSLPQF